MAHGPVDELADLIDATGPAATDGLACAEDSLVALGEPDRWPVSRLVRPGSGLRVRDIIVKRAGARTVIGESEKSERCGAIGA